MTSCGEDGDEDVSEFVDRPAVRNRVMKRRRGYGTTRGQFLPVSVNSTSERWCTRQVAGWSLPFEIPCGGLRRGENPSRCSRSSIVEASGALGVGMGPENPTGCIGGGTSHQK